jgi:hypothetical protein
MNEENIINEKDLDLENPDLKKEAVADTVVKQFLVNYTGDKLQPENEKVTVEMIVETVAEEFPEFLMAVAEENWMRGYHQALTDVDVGIQAEKEQNEKLPTEEEK